MEEKQSGSEYRQVSIRACKFEQFSNHEIDQQRVHKMKEDVPLVILRGVTGAGVLVDPVARHQQWPHAPHGLEERAVRPCRHIHWQIRIVEQERSMESRPVNLKGGEEGQRQTDSPQPEF